MADEVRIERGIYRNTFTGTWRVFVRVAGKLTPERYPAEWGILQVRRARATLEEQLRARADTPALVERPEPGTFAEDCVEYLKLVRSMPTYKGRCAEIAKWVALFGPRRRTDITRLDITKQIEEWLAQGYAGSTVKKWRTALMSVWSTLDGKGAANPVKSSKLPDEAEPTIRNLPQSMMRTILRLMRPCKTRYRLELMMVAGLAPKQIMGIRPEHVDLVHMDVANGIAGTVWIGRREKGKKTAGFVKPLSEEGANALRRFMAWDCWGTYSASSAGKSFRRCSADKLLLADLRPYDFRHSYITEAYRATGDLRATQILAGHASIEITARYALGAVDERVKIAFAAFSQTQKLPVRVTSHGKSL